MQHNAQTVFDWAIVNELELNIKKIKVMIFGSTHQLINPITQESNNTITQQSNYPKKPNNSLTQQTNNSISQQLNNLITP